MLRPVSPSRAPAAGLATRLVLFALASLLGLLVVVGTTFDAAAGMPRTQDRAAFDLRRGPGPVSTVRIERTAIDLDESASHGRIVSVLPGPRPSETGSLHRPASDRPPSAADCALPERPPRA